MYNRTQILYLSPYERTQQKGRGNSFYFPVHVNRKFCKATESFAKPQQVQVLLVYKTAHSLANYKRGQTKIQDESEFAMLKANALIQCTYPQGEGKSVKI